MERKSVFRLPLSIWRGGRGVRSRPEMELTTPINITPISPTISYGDGLLFLGSCFADEVGGICRGLGFNAQVNPFGTLYNPCSVANSLYRLKSGQPFCHEEVVKVGEDYYCTFSHNTDFWCPSEEAVLEKVNQHLVEAHAHFLQSKWVVISLGTSWAFREKMTGQVVSNCHKLPASRFARTFLSMEQSVEILSNMLRSIPDKQFIFTVSPLRHLKDGLHENQLSKAALLLAVDQVCKDFDNAHYFPAYEILLDELRDYRFYKEDMVHPTDQAVRYIFEKFVQFAVNPSEYPAMAAAEEVKKMLQHKPLFPDSDAYRKFEQQRDQKTSEIKQKFSNIILENL